MNSQPQARPEAGHVGTAGRLNRYDVGRRSQAADFNVSYALRRVTNTCETGTFALAARPG
jgi:hypothetical protein